MMEKFNLEQKEQEKFSSNIILMDEVASPTVDMIREHVPNGRVFCLDYNLHSSGDIPSVEQWNEFRIKDGTLLGFWIDDGRGRVVNIDHHSNNKEFFRQFSTTNAAILYVREFGIVEDPMVIHHVDCDSTLSSLILSGALPPDDQFGEAAIAADHTGDINDIADLTQALFSLRDLEYSGQQLKRFLVGGQLDARAQQLLQKWHNDRERAAKVEFHQIGDVFWAVVEEKIDGSFLPALLPNAKVIILASPMPDNSNKWEIKIRAGKKFPPMRSLNELDLPQFGGRWNAGSTKRSGGSEIRPQDYATIVDEKLIEMGM